MKVKLANYMNILSVCNKKSSNIVANVDIRFVPHIAGTTARPSCLRNAIVLISFIGEFQKTFLSSMTIPPGQDFGTKSSVKNVLAIKCMRMFLDFFQCREDAMKNECARSLGCWSLDDIIDRVKSQILDRSIHGGVQ